jgi:predicted nucleic acid-binding protein
LESTLSAVLIDTNVIFDILKADPDWMPWSANQLALARQQMPLRINIVVYAELCSHRQTQSQIDGFLQAAGIQIPAISTAAALTAAQAFLQYKQRGGGKTGVLPDFFIGAQAQAEGWTLLTRDAARYRTYFPSIQLICPA